MDKVLNIENLVLGYTLDKLVLNEISLDIQASSFVTIIGPNGSGKSTLLKSISKLLKPSQGKIEIFGRDMETMDHRELATKMAVVHQENKIEFDFTVEDIVLMGRSPHLKRFQNEGAKDMEIAQKAMELTETSHLKGRLITELSGGERQRVMIARAIAQNPNLILLDEPTAHLDIHHQVEILELLKRLNQKDGITVVVVLHDINLAARYSQKIAIMKEGRLVDYGLPREVITKDILRMVYGVEMSVEEKAVGGYLNVIPLYTIKPNQDKEKREKIHVICGGGSGWELMIDLKKEGYKATAGVLNVGDSDFKLAQELAMMIVQEHPFSPISLESHNKNLKVIDGCDIVMIASIAVGNGNIKNLEAAQYAVEKGKKVYLFGEWSQHYDFTHGKAMEMVHTLLQRGVKHITNIDEIKEV